MHIDGPFLGKAQVVIATDRIESVQNIDAPKGGVDVPVTGNADWPGGAYVLVTLYRPLDAPARPHEPTRAVGLAYIGLDQSAHKLSVALGAPGLIRPRGKLSVPVAVTGGGAGPVHLTLAAVDKGILGLTAWKQPDVFDLIYGTRQLAVDVTDTYAHLLAPTGAAGAIHEGGDEGGGPTGLAVTSTRVVSLFSGEIEPDANGHATVTLDVSDFEGSLDLMATAWRDDAVGVGSGETIVRDPVFADLTLPRFLAPGDAATSLVSLVNTDGEAGRYAVSVKADGAAEISGPHEFSADLAKGERQSFPMSLMAKTAGVAHMTATLHDAGGRTVLTRSWDMEIRSGHLPLTQSQLRKQTPGESYTVDPAVLAGFEPGASLTLSYSGVGGIDTVGLLQSLESFSWGSSESLAAAARPLLLFKGPNQLGRETVAQGVDKRINDAIATLMDREDAGGRIGDWRLNDGGTLPWTQIYLVDFLSRAKAAGYAVPDEALRHALDWLDTEQAQGRSSPDDDNASDMAVTPDSRAYALYVLARAGRLDAPALRSLYDNVNSLRGANGQHTLFWGGGEASEATRADALALGHLAGGLALGSQRSASNDVFGMAVDALGPKRTGRPDLFDWGYWAYVRNLAGLTPLAAESGNEGLAQKLVERFEDLTLSPAELSDQTKTGLLETADAMNRDTAGRGVTVNGKKLPSPLQLPVALTPSPTELNGYTVSNSGRVPVWLAVTTTGTPKGPTKPVSQGFSLTVSTESLTGEPLDPASLRQNDRFLVVIHGSADDRDLHHCVLADMLPAGWEIEGLAKGAHGEDGDRDSDGGGFSFLGETTKTRSASLQDDRLVAAFDLHGDDVRNRSNSDALGPSEFRIAYIARAVTPGHFLRPETVVQDRYRPTQTARTASGNTDIAPR